MTKPTTKLKPDELLTHLHDALGVLGLTELRRALDESLDEPIQDESRPAWLWRLVEPQLRRRVESRAERRVRESRLPVRKTFEAFNFAFQPKLDKDLVMELTTLRFLAQGKNVLLAGMSGTGKSNIALALALLGQRQPSCPLHDERRHARPAHDGARRPSARGANLCSISTERRWRRPPGSRRSRRRAGTVCACFCREGSRRASSRRTHSSATVHDGACTRVAAFGDPRRGRRHEIDRLRRYPPARPQLLRNDAAAFSSRNVDQLRRSVMNCGAH